MTKVRSRLYLANSDYLEQYVWALYLMGVEIQNSIKFKRLNCHVINIICSDEEASRFETYLLKHGLWVDDVEAMLDRRRTFNKHEADSISGLRMFRTEI